MQGKKDYKLIFAVLSIVIVTAITYRKVFYFPTFAGGWFDLNSDFFPSDYPIRMISDPYTLREIFLNYFEKLALPRATLLHPVIWYMANESWGTNHIPYHVSGLIIYAATCVNVFLLLRILFNNFTMALSCSLLYAVFYLNYQHAIDASNCITDNPGILFLTMAMVIYLYYPVSRKIAFISCFFYFLSLQLREAGIFMPVVLFLLCRYMGRQPKLKDFYPFVATFILYCLIILLRLMFVFQFGHEAETSILGLSSTLNHFRWELIYSMFPGNLGDITLVSYLLGHLWLFATLVFYIVVKDAEIRRKINVLFPSAIIFLSLYVVAGRGLEARYFPLPLIFTIPIAYIVITETLTRILPEKLPVQAIITVVIAALISVNYVSTQKIIGKYSEVAELRMREFEAGKVLSPPGVIRMRFEPRFMSQLLWDSPYQFNLSQKYLEAYKQRDAASN